MRVLKINNNYSSEKDASITTKDCEWWFLNGRLHRSVQPAVITKYSGLYYHRGIKISKAIANGELSPQEIMKIDNMEIRQSAMEILGYEKFLSCSKEIHRYSPDGYEAVYPTKTNPMYQLFIFNTGLNEENDPIKILSMVDPSKVPLIKYFIRVHPDEVDCRLAVAHSYDFKTWEEYIENKNWV